LLKWRVCETRECMILITAFLNQFCHVLNVGLQREMCYYRCTGTFKSSCINKNMQTRNRAATYITDWAILARTVVYVCTGVLKPRHFVCLIQVHQTVVVCIWN
jgi:hypothetical protein